MKLWSAYTAREVCHNVNERSCHLYTADCWWVLERRVYPMAFHRGVVERSWLVKNRPGSTRPVGPQRGSPPRRPHRGIAEEENKIKSYPLATKRCSGTRSARPPTTPSSPRGPSPHHHRPTRTAIEKLSPAPSSATSFHPGSQPAHDSPSHAHPTTPPLASQRGAGEGGAEPDGAAASLHQVRKTITPRGTSNRVPLKTTASQLRTS